jgi:hypothetical protein
MEVSYIVVVSICCCNDNGVVRDGKCTSSTLRFIKAFHALLKHILVFHHKENLGLFNVQTLIQVLAYGCLKGLSKVVHIVVTKSGICL